VVDTIKAIEKEYPGLKQHQMVKSNKKIVAGTEYYDTNDLQVRGSENEIRRITYADNPNVTRGVVRTSSILKSLHLSFSPGKGSLKNCLGQSKGSWKVMGQLRRPS
jgi:hypothetical protein